MHINLFPLKALMFIVLTASALPTQNDHHPELFFHDHLCTGCNVDVPVEGHGCEVCWQRSAGHHYPRLGSQPLYTLVPEEQQGTRPLTLPHHHPEHSVMDTSESLNSLPSSKLPHELVAEQHTGLPTISQPEHTLSQSSTASQLPQPSPQQHNEPSVHPSPEPSSINASSPKSLLPTPQLSTEIPDQHQAPPLLPPDKRKRKPRNRLVQTANGQMVPSSTVSNRNRRIANGFFQDYVTIAREFKGLDLSKPEVRSAAVETLQQEFKFKYGDGRRMDYGRIAQVAEQNGIVLRGTFELPQ